MRKGTTVALQGGLAAELREWTKELKKRDRVFKVPSGMLRIMDRDLEFAGIEKRDLDGTVIHLHALRHTFGTHLSKAGVAPRVAQAAMRHSDIALTMNTYTDPRLLDMNQAVESLPSIPLATSDAIVSTDVDTDRTVAPMVAPTPGDLGHFEYIADHQDQRQETLAQKENPAKTNVSLGSSESGRLDSN